MALTFSYLPPDDESTDPQYDLMDGATDTRISIQDCRSYGGGWAVVEYSGEGDSLTMTFRGTFPSLTYAKTFAINLRTTR